MALVLLRLLTLSAFITLTQQFSSLFLDKRDVIERFQDRKQRLEQFCDNYKQQRWPKRFV